MLGVPTIYGEVRKYKGRYNVTGHTPTIATLVYLPGRGKTRHFKSKESYRKFKAFIHIHDVPRHKDEFVFIGGKRHRVKHLY